MSDFMTFRRRLGSHILSGRKTATIRNKEDGDYRADQVVAALSHEDGSKICRLEILSVESVQYRDLNHQHASAEYVPFVFVLKWIIRRIYPGETDFIFIRFRVVND